jgi:predicted nucleotidyltransferase
MISDDDKEIFYFNFTSVIAHEFEEIFQDDLISVVVFGSAARGEAGVNDDIDVLIVVEKFEKNPSLIQDVIPDGLSILYVESPIN